MAETKKYPPIVISGGGGKKKRETPTQAAARAAAVKAAKLKLAQTQGVPSNASDPYVTINNRGDLVPVSNSRQAMRDRFGKPLTFSQAERDYNRFNKLWMSYLGRPINAHEFQEFLKNGWSDYHITNTYLSTRPNFTKSPIWKNRYNDYADVWHQIYGDNSQPDQEAIKYAVINGLNTSGFGDYLRHQPGYQNSSEFKDRFAASASAYQQVFGLPDTRGDQLIRQAALANWTPTQFQTWLRQTPEWKSSDEAQGLYQGLVQRFGLLPQSGGQTALAPAGPIQSVNPLAIPGGDTAPATGSPGAP